MTSNVNCSVLQTNDDSMDGVNWRVNEVFVLLCFEVNLLFSYRGCLRYKRVLQYNFDREIL